MFIKFCQTKNILLLLFLLINLKSFSQQSIISGKITDYSNEPLTGATAELRNSLDSTLTKVNVADGKGQFSFVNIKEGKYFVKISLLGFVPFNSDVFTYDGVSIKELPSFKISASTVTLKEANISAIKPLIEVRPDKTIFNIDNSNNNTDHLLFP